MQTSTLVLRGKKRIQRTDPKTPPKRLIAQNCDFGVWAGNPQLRRAIKSVRDVDLSRTRISAQLIGWLVPAEITDLSLNECKTNRKVRTAWPKLVEGLARFTSLRRADLTGLPIRAEDLGNLVEAWTDLTHLILRACNHLTKQDLIDLADHTERFGSLEELDISHNLSVDDDVVEAFRNARPNVNVLSNNTLTTACIRAMEATQVPDQAIEAPLKRHKGEQVVDLLLLR